MYSHAVIMRCLSAQTFEEMLGHPDLAEMFNYCAWQFENGADVSGVDAVEATLGSEENTTVSQRASAAFIDAGVKIAQNAKDKDSCEKAFKQGLKVYDKMYSKTAKKLRKGDKFKVSEEPDIAIVQQKISTLWVEDQARRRAYNKFRRTDKLDAPLWTSALARAHGALIDATSTSYMKEVLAEYDWVDAHRFGQKISNHAWIIVQHADRDPVFQVLALERMTPYLENEGVSKSNYAYLFDRVAVNHDRKQRYGTQPTWECTETGLVLAPLEDPESVNARRAEMGMGTVEKSLAEMTASVCGK